MQKRQNLLQDILLSVVAIAIWVGTAYGILYFLPGATWIWYVVLAYAVLTLLPYVVDSAIYAVLKKIFKV